ncbi:hypothetical protein [Mycobacterium sp.]|uniref:SLC41A family transporter n=1 Tax=Mycobacterium sp. TaxID=1785 RepID=UPI002D31DD69|nr:hypothetical protein [Mycobacterium sp.]HZA09775.1 hypothetical protein [Mycobacterium sp.]
MNENESHDEASGGRQPSEPATSTGESLRARQDSSGPIETPADDTRTHIIQREPSGPIPTPPADDTRTSIIRRHPTGPIPEVTDAPTSLVKEAPADELATGIIRQAPRRIARTPGPPSPVSAMAATTLSILNGWATAVIATDLITGWWRSDRLFCVGVGFLAAVCGASIIAGVIQLLLRRRAGIYLTIVGSVLAVLIFAGIFVTGAHVGGLVRAMPAIPAAAALFAVLPPTWRWTRRD